LSDNGDNVVGEVEVGGPELSEGGLEVKQANEVRIGQDAKGSSHEKAAPLGLGTPVPLIYQKPVGSNRNSERDGGALAGIQKS
jgi:hypothetical protein